MKRGCGKKDVCVTVRSCHHICYSKKKKNSARTKVKGENLKKNMHYHQVKNKQKSAGKNPSSTKKKKN